jgi:hypothetical protein
LNYIGRNSLLGNRKKIAKLLMGTFTCRSTFLYDRKAFPAWRIGKHSLGGGENVPVWTADCSILGMQLSDECKFILNN